MGFRATFTLEDILKYQKQQEKIIFESQLSVFVEAGEKFIIDTHDSGSARTFKDYTGNLRSGIGYIIVYNGKQVAINFQLSSIGTDKDTGLQTGTQLAELLSEDYKSGFAMILVSGMDYSIIVEYNNKTVITEASLDFEQNVKRLFSNI